jgi:hypothetical protein
MASSLSSAYSSVLWQPVHWHYVVHILPFAKQSQYYFKHIDLLHLHFKNLGVLYAFYNSLADAMYELTSNIS